MSVFTCPPICFPSLAGGDRLFACLTSLVSQFICFPAWLVVSGSLDVSLRLSPNSNLVPSVARGAQHLSPNSIFLSVWPVVSGFPAVCLTGFPLHLLPILAGGIRLFRYLSSLVSQCGRCLRMFVFTGWWYPAPFIGVPVWLVVPGSPLDFFPSLPSFFFPVCLWCLALRVSLLTCFRSFVAAFWVSFFHRLPQCGQWCPALCGCPPLLVVLHSPTSLWLGLSILS